MTFAASTFGGFLGGWSQGCLVVLIAFWLLLALLGVRNGRFPRRVLGGAAFVVGSALWIGLHQSLAEAFHLDAGVLGRSAWHSIGRPLADSSLASSAIGALLLVSSLVGLLIATDWLPLAPLRPLLASFERRWGGRLDAGAASPAVTLPMARASAAAVLEREPPRNTAAASPAPAAPPPAAPTTSPVEPTTASASLEIAEAPVLEPKLDAPADIATTPEPRVSDAAATVEIEEPEVDADARPARERTNWARFRPQASPRSEQEDDADLAVDNADAATHNSSTPEGESRASSEDADAAEPSGEPAATAPATPTEPEEKDPPVLDRDRLEDAATATLPEPPQELEELATELSPKRKKEEPEEEPEKEPGEGDEEPDEEGEDGEEWEEGEEGEEEDEEFEEDEDEEWEEGEEEEEEETEEEGEEEDEEEEDEEDEDDDEDWEDDEEEGEEDKDDDDKDDKDEEKEDWDDDKGASDLPPPTAESTLVAEDAAPAVVEPETTEPEPAPIAEASLPPELPAHLFADLPDEERQLVARAIDAIVGTESVSLSKLQRELGVTYYAAARVFERLEKEGCIAPYSGSLARTVRITRSEWDERRKAT